MAVNATTALQEHELLDAARSGDEDAFGRIVEEHRLPLHAHCYRMLGSVQDAEDALQETFLRAWRGLSEFGGRSSLRTWLYRIATNVCIDATSRRAKRMLPTDVGAASRSNDVDVPLVETTWVEPYPDELLGIADGYAAPGARYEQREAVELAFIASLQHLPANQRAVLILRDVLGFSAREVAERLDTSVASVNSALQRARKTVEERLPERSQQATLRALGDEEARELVEAYVDAWSRRDVEAVAALLAEDAVFSMPPWAEWWQGRDKIAGFAANEDCLDTRTFPSPVRVNGQLGIAAYSLDEETGRYVPAAIDVLTLEGGLIKEITAFVTPEVFPRFGLPPVLEP
jgi:RNA polymerase sigma-70 factor, ECF subfamily